MTILNFFKLNIIKFWTKLSNKPFFFFFLVEVEVKQQTFFFFFFLEKQHCDFIYDAIVARITLDKCGGTSSIYTVNSLTCLVCLAILWAKVLHCLGTKLNPIASKPSAKVLTSSKRFP